MKVADVVFSFVLCTVKGSIFTNRDGNKAIDMQRDKSRNPLFAKFWL